MQPTMHASNTEHPKRPEDEPSDTRPFLCIPYWESPRFLGDSVDTGQIRPLPGDVISWECPGIHASPYRPGEVLEVIVDVRNSGHGNATSVATVVVYWADPCVGFAQPTLFGVASVAAPTLRDPVTPGVVSVTLRAVIPPTAPKHICLLAYVTHSLDRAPVSPDPCNDRHWAQRNLIAVNMGAYQVLIPFMVANPSSGSEDEEFDLQVRALDRHALELRALRKNLEPGGGHLRFRLLDAQGVAVTDHGEETQARLTVRSQGRKRLSLLIEVDAHWQPHQVVVAEVLLFQRERLVGSLGIELQGDPESLQGEEEHPCG